MYHQTNMGETWWKRANYCFDNLHLDHPEVPWLRPLVKLEDLVLGLVLDLVLSLVLSLVLDLVSDLALDREVGCLA